MDSPMPSDVAAELRRLADRVETASGPDQDLAEASLRAVGWHVDAYSQAIRPNGERAFRIPDPLSCLDDAMALVPKGWVVGEMSWWPDAQIATCHMDDRKGLTGCSGATTLPLALTAAALRARAAIQEPSHAK